MFYTVQDEKEMEKTQAFYETLEDKEEFLDALGEVISEEYDSDGESAKSKYGQLVQKYLTEYTEAEKILVDTAFIAICGWSLNTLLSKAIAEM